MLKIQERKEIIRKVRLLVHNEARVCGWDKTQEFVVTLNKRITATTSDIRRGKAKDKIIAKKETLKEMKLIFWKLT